VLGCSLLPNVFEGRCQGNVHSSIREPDSNRPDWFYGIRGFDLRFITLYNTLQCSKYMEEVKTEAVEVEKAINHPHMENLKATLVTQKTMKECLERRLRLIDVDLSKKSEYEKNEIEITKIRTIGEIDVLKRVIYEKENYFIKYMQQFIKDLEELDKNYDKVIAQARTQAKTNTHVDNTLKSVKWDVVKTNMEVKIHLYKRLKDLMK